MRRSLIAGVVLAVVLAACGSGSAGKAATKPSESSKVSTVALVTGAADAAASARTAKISGQMSLAFGGKQVDVPIDGAIDFVHQAADLRVDMSKLVGAAGASAAGISGAVDIRMVDGTMYMNMGSMLGSRADSVLHGKDWVSIDISQMATQGGTQNPADMLQSLRGAGSVREVGTEDIDGTPTTHYHAEIDLQKAIEKVPAQYRDLAEKGMKMLGGSFPIDVWIDHDGLPRRFQMDIEVPGGKGSVSERIDFTDYGAPVTIEAPPADQVQSMGDFQRVASGV
jgi:hypothetical protein